MYLYFDENDYVVGYGSDYEKGSVEINSVPAEVDKYLGAYKYDSKSGAFIPDEDRKNYLESLWSAEHDLIDLENWFKWYDQQYIQWQRAQRLGLSFNQDMQALDEEAVTNAQKILEYREFLATPYTPNEVEG